MLSAVFSMCLWWEAVCVLMIVSVDTFGVKKTHTHDRVPILGFEQWPETPRCDEGRLWFHVRCRFL